MRGKAYINEFVYYVEYYGDRLAVVCTNRPKANCLVELLADGSGQFCAVEGIHVITIFSFDSVEVAATKIRNLVREHDLRR